MGRTFSDYLAFLRQLIPILEQLTAVEQRKLAAVQADDLPAVNDCMKEEQALSMTLRGLEQKRARLRAELSLPEMRLRELPQHCPPELAAETAQVVDAVLGKSQVLSSAQKAARTVMETRLHRIDKALRRHGLAEEDNLAPPPGGGSRTDIKV